MDKGSLGQGPEGAVTGDKPLVASQGPVTTPVSAPLVSGENVREELPEQEQDQERTQEYDRAQEQERTLEHEPPARQARTPSTGEAREPLVRERSGNGPGPVSARTMRLTPGGGYGALLAHSRPKQQQSDGAEVKSEGPGEALTPPPFGRVTDPLEVTAVGGTPAESRPGTSGGAARRPRIITPEHTVPTGSEFDGSEITVVGGAIRGPASDSGSGASPAGSGTATGGVPAHERKSAIPRPTRLTPGSGGLAALLAQGRNRARAEQPAVDREAPTQPPAVETPTIAATQGTEPAQSAAPTSAPAARKSGFATTLRPGVVTPPRIEVESGPASVPEAKKAGFAGTLLGVPPPDIDVSEHGGKDAPWVKRFAGVGAGNAPRGVDDVEWTEKNSAIPEDNSGGQSLGDSAGSVTSAADRRRITASFDVPRGNWGNRKAIGAGIAAAVLVAIIAVLWPRPHHTPPLPAVTGVAPPASVVEPLASPPAAVPTPPDQPSAVPAPAEVVPGVGTAPSPEVVQAKRAPAPAPTVEPGAATTAAAPPAAGEGVAPVEAPSVMDEPTDPSGAPSMVGHRAMASATEVVAPSARKQSKAKVKTKRKSTASRSRREGSTASQPAEVKSDAPRSKAPEAESDPDATLPLLMGR